MVHLPVLIKVTAMEVFHYSLTMNCTLLSLQKELLKNIKAKKRAPNRASAVTGQLLQQFNVTIICMVLGTYLVFKLYEEQIKINFMNNNTLSNSSVLLQAIGTLLIVNNFRFLWLATLNLVKNWMEGRAQSQNEQRSFQVVASHQWHSSGLSSTVTFVSHFYQLYW